MGYGDGPRPSLDDPNVWVPYRYVPSKPAAVVFVVAFSLTTFLHTFQLVNKRTWYFIPLVIGGFFEIVGYIGRILSTNDLWALGPFIMQSLLLLVAPALFAASIYIILGRIILLVDGERYSLIRHKWLTKVFVTGDVLSFLVQGGGGGIQAMHTLAALHTGEKLIIVGLFLQLAFFGFFIFVAGLFHYRLVNANPSKQSSAPISLSSLANRNNSPRRVTASSSATPTTLNVDSLPWKRHIYALYAASTLIMIRGVFRVIEYLMGNSGYLLRHEYFLYIFDAFLMFLVMGLFNWIHPSQVTARYQQRILRERAETAPFRPSDRDTLAGAAK
ncbi:RTA1-domain-containing protein [Lindgomyces ingoldianus]|uniref:RTA1-domain-containing protein n=1 Tax=Lindgomyces ingoldianus TaxID=673940 RepID=A0ACB6R0X8_9PLEO|nr:RTA1-domain-containing protein [Lindgomyces ingoldianus]KAF2472796.1 RTA1-domain-containing protein [Lindgomyces ingoldianus]